MSGFTTKQILEIIAKNNSAYEAYARWRWIPVAETLPPPNIDVAVLCYAECLDGVRRRPEIGRCHSPGKWLVGSGLPVSHWMKLPNFKE